MQRVGGGARGGGAERGGGSRHGERRRRRGGVRRSRQGHGRRGARCAVRKATWNSVLIHRREFWRVLAACWYIESRSGGVLAACWYIERNR